MYVLSFMTERERAMYIRSERRRIIYLAVGIYLYRSRGGNKEISHIRYVIERRGLTVLGYNYTELYTIYFYNTYKFPLQDQ